MRPRSQQQYEDEQEFTDLAAWGTHLKVVLTVTAPDGKTSTLTLHDLYVSRASDRVTDKADLRIEHLPYEQEVTNDMGKPTRRFQPDGDIEVDLRLRGRLYGNGSEAYRIEVDQ